MAGRYDRKSKSFRTLMREAQGRSKEGEDKKLTRKEKKQQENMKENESDIHHGH